jgi:LL-diaminopimelate aminotransferase
MRVNETFSRLEQSYLFSTISRKVNAYKAANPEARVIRLGIGDVTLPLAPAVIRALHDATDEMGRAETFRGYCDDAEGYEFLRKAVADHYAGLGATLGVDEVFVSDGAKSDLGNFLDILAPGSTVLIPDPVYPAYVDTNVMAGNDIVYVHGTAADGFLPLPDPAQDADLVYICSPNNPTGATYDAQGLAAWVAYALEKNALILFDSAYEAFIRTPDVPHTIYEIDGAERCAVEVSSLSKRAGFTGVRCGFTVVPKTLTVADGDLNALWRRRQNTKFNGVPYIVQRAAEAVFGEVGRRETAAQVDVYLGNARTIAAALDEMGVPYTGGTNSPYIWMKCPGGMRSWDFFDLLLEKAQVVGTPGVGFGPAGEGYFRFSAFGRTEDCKEAMARMKAMLVSEGLVG